MNQDGPEQFGFRGNSRHLDLNRDFVKCDTLTARVFNELFTAWDPDVMVDTHTSNGADYSYTMTLIHTQADKLGGGLGEFLRADDAARDVRRDGCARLADLPVRQPGAGQSRTTASPNSWKPHASRPATRRCTTRSASCPRRTCSSRSGTATNRCARWSTSRWPSPCRTPPRIQALRRAAKDAGRTQAAWPVRWKMDEANPSSFRFKGYEAKYRTSVLGDYSRLYYDRSSVWERDIAYYNRFPVDVTVPAPQAYVVPQQWREAIERLEWNGVRMERIDADRMQNVAYYHIDSVTSRPSAYEGHMFHDDVVLERRHGSVQLRAGDFLVPLDQDNARYAVETLEPLAHDSFFRWGFFNSVLEKKEAYSEYVFEDEAERLLAQEPELAAKFEQWKGANPGLLTNQEAVLDFIFANCARYREPEWRRYPVFMIER